VVATSLRGIETSNRFLEFGNHLEDLERIESEIGDQIVVEDRFDRTPAHVLEHVDHTFFDLRGGPVETCRNCD